MEIKQIPLDNIIILKNVRSMEDHGTESDDITSLANSMMMNGQKVEIRVYPGGGKGMYILLAGQRRLLAARINGWETIRSIVEEPPVNEVELIIGQYNENEEREGMSYLDKAKTYARLKELGMSQHQIAEQFGKSDTEISLALATLRADPKLQKAIDDGQIKPSALEPLLSQPVEVQNELADAAIKAKTVRNVSKLVKAHQRKAAEYSTRKAQEVEIPEDADPLELLALDELKQAVEHAKAVEQARISHPELLRKARPTVEELLRTAASIKMFVDGNTWEDTIDLV
jgi:ParB/RepB/Spo0J family partition protein